MEAATTEQVQGGGMPGCSEGGNNDLTESRRPVGEAKPQYLPYRPPNSEFTPPASPQPMNPYSMVSAKKSFGSGRQRHPGNLQTNIASAPAYERPTYSPSPSSSPPLPPELPSPQFAVRKRAPSLLRQTNTPSPLNEGFPRADQPTASPTLFPMRGPGLPGDLRAGFNPLSSNPVNTTGPSWRSSGEDNPWVTQSRARGMTSSSHTGFPHPPLRSATSIPDYSHLRGADRPNLSGAYRPNRGGTNWSHNEHYLIRQWRPDEPRASFRSNWTNASSSFLEASGTERSSIATKRSSISENRISVESRLQSEHQSSMAQQDQPSEENDGLDDVMSSEDVIDMYNYSDDDAEPQEKETYDVALDEGYISQRTAAPTPEVHNSQDVYRQNGPEPLRSVQANDSHDSPYVPQNSHSSRRPYLPSLQLSPLQLQYSPTQLQHSPEAHSPTKYRQSPRESHSSVQVSQSPGEYGGPMHRRPSAPESPTEYGGQWHRGPSGTGSQQSPTGHGGPWYRRTSDTGSQRSPSEQGGSMYRRPSAAQSQHSPTGFGVSMCRRPSATGSQHSPTELRYGPMGAPFDPDRLRNEINHDMKQLPHLRRDLRRMSKQDWQDIYAYAQKHRKLSLNESSDLAVKAPKVPQHGLPALAPETPEELESTIEPLPEIEAVSRPRRNSNSIMERHSRLMFDAPPPPPPKSKTLDFDSKKPTGKQRTSQTMAKSMGRPLGRTSSASPTSTVFLPRHVMSVEYHPRDKYGFKKKTTEVTVEQYDRWYDKYEGYVKRRTKKWEALMKKHDCSMDDPCRFPERNDTVKRYARKGYPPQWRGAMWWYYSGGQMTLGQKTGVYDALLMRCKLGELNETDRELIERDLHRTFPDNIHFKPDEVKTPDNLIGATTEEPDMIRSLRNVLQVFAMNNPSIGYCQSLNFIAGLLLLFLKQDEERVFILMEIITHHHLPGAHARSLMNVDVGALMMLVQEYLPTVWNSINDIDIINSGAGSSAHPASKHARLPSVNIACTSWFMSLFIGTLPIETVLRVWDAFLYEGPKALFRYALAIFKTGEAQIRRCPADSPELFQIVQNLPRKCLDPNELYKIAFARRPFGNLNQGIIDSKRAFWKEEILKQREEHAKLAEGQKDGLLAVQTEQVEGEKENGGLKRKMSRRFLKRSASKKNLKV